MSIDLLPRPYRRAHLVAGLVAACCVTLSARAEATVITASPVNFSASEQSTFSGPVATFTDDDPGAAPTDFVAVIDWGDGSAGTIGTITGSGGTFTVSGAHAYDDEGTFSVTVTITDQEPGTGFASVTDTATIDEADVLAGTPRTFAAPSGASFTTTVATFTDALTSAVPGDFTATIDWGDATTSAGTVSGGGGTFQVSGTHTYAAPGNYSVLVTLSDDAPGTATAKVTSTAQVAAGLAVAAVSFSTAEGAAFDGTVATFSDADPTRTAADFTATIAWGDGTTSAGTVSGGPGAFTVSGQHTYPDEGSFSFTVTVTDSTGPTAQDSATATVAEADVLSGSPTTFAATVDTHFTGTVATFTDTDTTNVPGDFTATIDWGDGVTTAGTVTGGSGTFVVSGTHTYASSGSFPVTVTLTDDAPGTATATVSSTAIVAAAVPTLDEAALAALGLVLAALGVAWTAARR